MRAVVDAAGRLAHRVRGARALRAVRHPAERRGVRHLSARLEVRAVLRPRLRSHRRDELDRLQRDGVVEGLVVVARVALDRVRERVHPGRGRDRGRQAEHELGIDERDVRADERRAADVELDLAVVVRDDRPERHLAAGAGGRRDRDERRDALPRSDRGPTRSRRSSRRARRRRRSTWPCPSTSLRRRATRPSHSDSAYRAAPSSTSAMSGFGRTWSKTTASASWSRALSTRPAAATPGSVTSSGPRHAEVVDDLGELRDCARSVDEPRGHLDGANRLDLDRHAASSPSVSLCAWRRGGEALLAPTLGVRDLVEREDMEAADVGPLLTRLSSRPVTSGSGSKEPESERLASRFPCAGSGSSRRRRPGPRCAGASFARRGRGGRCRWATASRAPTPPTSSSP